MLHPRPQAQSAFTLIELLIVVAIIAILAAIAVPNFLEAQMRAKVSRTRADMRTISLGLESYSIDNNGKYPPVVYKNYHIAGLDDRGGIFNAVALSTPVAYLTSTAMPDPFIKSQQHDIYGDVIGQASAYGNGGNCSFTYNYVNVPLYWKNKGKSHTDGRPNWYLISLGPDYGKGPNPFNPNGAASLNDFAYNTWPQDPGHTFDAWQYDASNGSISKGDIIRHP